MSVKKLLKGDTVKIISGSLKGTTGKIERVNAKNSTVVIEGIGLKHRHVKPTQLNPRGGHKDIHIPVSIHKVALVVDEKSSKTSRVGLIKRVDGTKARIARQANSKEIK
ncbi:MAG: ribosomal protein [Candidatus Saccharibacteria bacterium]|nr:ribosomal protein [Candidatus Saccharibacteria bacterium]